MENAITRSKARLPLRLLIISASILLYAATVFSISLGAMDISFKEAFFALLDIGSDAPDYVYIIIHEVRLPRTLLAIAIGGILAICGAVMQGLFRNPLADPSIIGVSAGASLGAAIAIVVLGNIIDNTLLLTLGTVPIFAFIGGAATTFAVYYLGTSSNGTSVTLMLLASVAISAIAGAGLGLMSYYADDQSLRNLSLWTMGSLAGASRQSLWLAYISLFFIAFFFMRLARPLNALLLGEAEARYMGINVQKLKRQLIFLTAAGVGVTVALAGMISFIGLVIPHIARQFTGPSHERLIPFSLLLGAFLLLFSDMVARTIVAPLEIPIGIITAAIGAPFFLGVLLKQRGRFT